MVTTYLLVRSRDLFADDIACVPACLLSAYSYVEADFENGVVGSLLVRGTGPLKDGRIV